MGSSGAVTAGASASVFSDWVPVLTAVTTNPTLGTGSSATGRYTENGKLVQGWARILFGTSGTAAGSGEYRISLPVPPRTVANLVAVGGGIAWPGTGSVVDVEAQIIASGTTMALYIATSGTKVAHNVPAGFTANGEIVVHFMYEAA